jgi:hypothetical protein
MVKAVHRADNGRGSALRQAFALPPRANSSTGHWLRTFVLHCIIALSNRTPTPNRWFCEFLQLMKR